MNDEVSKAVHKPVHLRTKRDVELLKTKGAIYGGCCDRFVDYSSCDCMERALDDPAIDPKSQNPAPPQQE